MTLRLAGFLAAAAVLLSPTGIRAQEGPVLRLVPRRVSLVARTVRAGATTTETARRTKIVIPTGVLFDADRTTPGGRARRTLRYVARQIRSEARGVVRIEGDTNEITDAATVALLIRRVTAVRRALVGFLPSGVSFRSPTPGSPGRPAARERSATTAGRIVITFPN